MIGAHDTFTYLKTTNFFAKTFPAFWRCQEKTVEELYNMGVRVFDVRVINESKDGFNWWRIGHGIATLEQRFVNLNNICIYFKQEYPGSIIRIVLESGFDEGSLERFKKEAKSISKKYADMLWTITIKKPWEDLYVFRQFIYKEYCCHLFNWNLEKSILENFKSFDMSSWSIKSWAKAHNPKEITKEMIEDKDTLYFMDYIGIYPEIKG